ncbi:hypothetical protein BDB00DRAFT_828988 [Zychaea mexicana]|uniref:uncharacterized protein n=1 Tax=Zychaea mexicana TaxID=64656 RepID=UPI0022FE272F|nr:uncharacterized protein BDB00DRAFT_828988 [Zychaea mexicana]KAI9492238.1 hypothetical protein BDB00DRAFT_828988 [Zychaea mexicana]
MCRKVTSSEHKGSSFVIHQEKLRQRVFKYRQRRVATTVPLYWVLLQVFMYLATQVRKSVLTLYICTIKFYVLPIWEFYVLVFFVPRLSRSYK